MPLPPLIPRSVLFGNPDHVAPSLSPDGTRLGYIAPDAGVLNVWVGPADRSAPARPVTSDRERAVRVYSFCHDDRHLAYLQDTGGNEDWRLHLLDLETGEERVVTPDKGVQARILAHNRWRPTEMLVALNADDPQLHDVYRLDLTTGELAKEVANPGFLDWLVDNDLVVRGGVLMQPDGSVRWLRRVGQDGWEVFLEVGSDDADSTQPYAFSRDGSRLLIVTSVDANTARLEWLDLTTGARTVVAEDPQYDVSGAWLHPETLEPQAVLFTKERQEIVLLDQTLRADLDRLRALGDGELGLSRSERSDRRWLVSVAPSDGPVRYFTYDRDSGQTAYLFSHNSRLEGHTLAPMEPFSFIARDGLTIHGYVTFPPGVERRGLPAVLEVHGGPWVRDMWGYAPEVQWLANRGYVCVQVNYRGSTGYGKAFLNAGDKQWARAMHDDLIDAVEHVVAQGWVDGARVGIFGGSYGGYAALVGAAFTPDVFRCAIDVVGPSNLITLLESIPDYWVPLRASLHRRVGHVEQERDLLWERSPLSRADAIRIPLLIAQGANDPRVKQAEAEQIVAALRAHGVPHEYLLFPDEGHGLVKPGNRERFYAAAERFLAEHLGGRVQEEIPPDERSQAVAPSSR